MVGQVLDYEIKRVYNDARSKGHEEGRAEGVHEVALSMLNDKMPFEQIIKYTGLDKETLSDLKKHISD